MNDIKVSICTITYNHEKYIEQTLDGVISQKTNFNFELLIHDDASTDNTAKIILEYQKKYPNIIKPIFQSKNLMSKGVYVDQTFNWPRIKGEYVAFLDGDDYWTDPHKLQKQADFLDTHPDYSIVFHPVQEIWEDGAHKTTVWGPNDDELTRLDEVIWERNIIATLSVMYRWRLGGKNISLWPQTISPGDYYTHLLHAQVGKIGFIPESMGVYRKHPSGIWYYENTTEDYFIRHFWPRIRFYESAKSQFNKDFTFMEIELLSKLFDFCTKQNNYSLLYKLKAENEKEWKNLHKQVQEYLSKYPAHNLFLSWVRYKLSIGKKRRQYKRYYLLDVAKEKIKKGKQYL